MLATTAWTRTWWSLDEIQEENEIEKNTDRLGHIRGDVAKGTRTGGRGGTSTNIVTHTDPQPQILNF